jgi:toxin ParE1/3/4
MRRLTWSPSSRRDLLRIRDWLAAHDVRAALATIRAIRAAAIRLADYPELGRALEEPFRAIGVRGTSYILVYRLSDSGVDIIRIRHGREDWLAKPEGEL